MDRLRDSVFNLLKVKGLTQSQLAKKAGVSSQAINQFLSGKTKEVKAETLIGIARAFGVSVEDRQARPEDGRNSEVVIENPLVHIGSHRCPDPPEIILLPFILAPPLKDPPPPRYP